MCLQAAGEPLSHLSDRGLNERCNVSRCHLRVICNREVIPIDGRYANDLQLWSFCYAVVSVGVNPGGGGGIGPRRSCDQSQLRQIPRVT